MDVTNSAKVQLHLIYKEQCVQTKSFKLEIEYGIRDSFKIDLQGRFRWVAAKQLLKISNLVINKSCGIVHAERVTTNLGPTAQMIVDDAVVIYQIYLPKR